MGSKAIGVCANSGDAQPEVIYRQRSPLRISISAIGKFHMFDLARQMLRLGQSVTLYTGNPMLKVDADLRASTRNYPVWHTMSALRHRFLPTSRSTWWQDIDMRTMGRWLARSVQPENTDVLDGLDGPGPDAGRLMKNACKVWVCNRGSAHILTQKQILEDEHRRWGASPPIFSDQHLDRCVAEYEEADAIVVPSDFAKQSFISHGLKPSTIYVQPYGVDLDLFKPVAKEDSTFRVLFVGALSIQKGIGYLLDAMKPLVDKRLAELWLVGAVDDAAKHILNRHKDVFIYKGLQSRSGLKWYYSQASVLVLPSIQEGLALVQAQAMACGIPVIASTNTGASNLFTDGVEGFIVPARDAKAIRDRVEWLIVHPHEHSVMKSAALARVEKLGGWNEYGERCLLMYRELVDAKTQGRLPH